MLKFRLNILLASGLAAGPLAWGKEAPATPKVQEKKEGRPEEAQKHFVAALQLALDCETAKEKNLMGEHQRMSKLVVEHYEKALKLAPGDGEILVSFGAHYFNAGQFELALAQYDQAIAAFRKKGDQAQLAEALFYKASTYYMREKFEEALKVLEEVLALDPKHEEALQVKASCLEHKKTPKP